MTCKDTTVTEEFWHKYIENIKSSYAEINSGVKRVQNMYAESAKSLKDVCRNRETRRTFWNMHVEIVNYAYVKISKPASYFRT